MLPFLSPNLMSGMASSLLMGGIKGLLSPSAQQAQPRPQSPVAAAMGLPQGRPVTMRPPMMLGGATYLADGDLVRLLEAQGGGSISPVDGGYAGGAGGRLGLNLPMGSGSVNAGISGDISGYDIKTPYGRLKGVDPRVSGGDVNYTDEGGASYGASYSENPMMNGETDRRILFNYSTPFADGGGIRSLPPVPPGETPQMGYAMDKGGMIRGPGGGVDDLIGGSIDNRQKVLLSDGEFVVPARVVSALGDGSSEAGAKVLHGMIDRVKSEADKRLKDNGEINLKKVLPA
jgi:hypothetical protein